MSSDTSVDDLLIVFDITRRMTEQHMVEPLLSFIAEQAFALSQAERCYIVLFEANDEISFLATRDTNGKPVRSPEREVSRSVLDQARQTLSSVLISSAIDDPEFHTARSVHALSLRSVLCVPLVSRGVAIGAIYLEHRSVRGRFSRQNILPLSLFAAQAAAAIENAARHEELEEAIAERTLALREANQRLMQQADELRQRNGELEALRDRLAEQSIRDDLTNLYNRRHLVAVLAQQYYAAQRGQPGPALVLIDIDNFKQINDRLLHHTGDEVLKTFAALLHSAARRSDIVGRYGGEEFLAIITSGSSPAIEGFYSRLRANIAEFDWTRIDQSLNQVTFSAGGSLSAEAGSVEQLLQIADRRLYAAKHQGKDCLVLDDSDRF